MCDPVTVEEALRRVERGFAGRTEAEVIRRQLDRFIAAFRLLGLDAKCVLVEQMETDNEQCATV